jgi:hypothetical protein
VSHPPTVYLTGKPWQHNRLLHISYLYLWKKSALSDHLHNVGGQATWLRAHSGNALPLKMLPGTGASKIIKHHHVTP